MSFLLGLVTGVLIYWVFMKAFKAKQPIIPPPQEERTPFILHSSSISKAYGILEFLWGAKGTSLMYDVRIPEYIIEQNADGYKNTIDALVALQRHRSVKVVES